MKVNERELFSALAAGLPHLWPLADTPELRTDSVLPDVALGRFTHGQMLDWKEMLEVTTLHGFVQQWALVPLTGGRVALAWRDALSERQAKMSATWQNMALPVLATLAAAPADVLSA